MMAIVFGPRFLRALRRIKPALTEEAEQCLQRVAAGFGRPHAHDGLGMRKLAVDAYEARLGLHYRIVFIHQGKRLVAYDVMTHDEVRRWLRGWPK